jgi:hypothetical protein
VWPLLCLYVWVVWGIIRGVDADVNGSMHMIAKSLSVS